jgi:UV DNA damage endonuclease
VLRLSREEQLQKLSQLCHVNALALPTSLQYCASHGIGCFRINSQILPLKTHPVAGYAIEELPNAETTRAAFRACGHYAARQHVRTVFHPDQFIVLNSPREEVVAKSIAELEYQAEVAEWVGADVLNIHGGGSFGDKQAAIDRFERNLERLPDAVRVRLTVENDDRIYSPADLLPLCARTALPLVYDVHHHRCLSDGLSVEQATAAAIQTWNREPLFHISSPRDGWESSRPQLHADFIDPSDFPACWRSLNVTVEVEAKAKEVAIARLQRSLGRFSRIPRVKTAAASAMPVGRG